MFANVHRPFPEPFVPSPIRPTVPQSLPSNLRMGAREWGLLVLLSALWGSATFFNKIAVQDIEPITMAFIRVLIATGILYAAIRVRGGGLQASREDWRSFFVIGLLNTAIPFVLIAWGVLRIDSGLAGILLVTTPIFTVILARVATSDEHVRPATALGIALGMMGVLVILGGEMQEITGGSTSGKVAILGAALAYACAGIYGRRLGDRPALTLAWGQLCASTIILAPLAFIFEQPWKTGPWSLPATSSVLALAVLSTALRYLVFFRLLATAGATNTSLVGYLIPATSLILGVGFLGERLQPADVAGMALVALALVIIDGRLVHIPGRRTRPRPLRQPRIGSIRMLRQPAYQRWLSPGKGTHPAVRQISAWMHHHASPAPEHREYPPLT